MKLGASNPGDQVPRDSWGAISDRLRAVEKTVREGFAAAGDLTGAVVRRGLLRIVDFGGLIVEGPMINPATGNPNGQTFRQFRWGALRDDPLYNHPDGSPQMGWLAYRDDGTIAMAIAELRANDGQYAQAVLWFDRAGNIILSEDTNSGRGLARPHLPYPTPQPTNLVQWLIHQPTAGSTDWTSIARSEPEPENARMAWNVRTIVDAGVTAEFRWCWQLDGGVQAPVSRTHTLVGDDPTTGYRFGFWRELNVPLPAGVTLQRRTTLDLQVRMTVGADGNRVARASVLAIGGDQS